jgi:hypothetical protein
MALKLEFNPMASASETMLSPHCCSTPRQGLRCRCVNVKAIALMKLPLPTAELDGCVGKQLDEAHQEELTRLLPATQHVADDAEADSRKRGNRTNCTRQPIPGKYLSNASELRSLAESFLGRHSSFANCLAP